MTPEVYTLGRIIVDLYANDSGVPLADVQSFQKYLGGSAANTAVGLARHGARVGLISRVGDDDFGTFLLQRLAKEGVDAKMVRRDPHAPSGLAFAALFPPNDSRVLFYRKPCADNNLTVADLDFEALASARLLVIACSALAVSPAREATLAALEAHKAAGGMSVLDIDWRPGFWAHEAEATHFYRVALGLADVVLANEPELTFAGGSTDPEESARRLLAMGVKQVVAKRGGEGCLYYGPEGERKVSPHRVDVVNTLGAGDGFGAAYTYGLLQGWSATRRLEYAVIAGALVVSRHSCSDAMPTRAQVETVMCARQDDGTGREDA